MNIETAANIAKSLEKLSKAMEEASKVFNTAFVKTSNSAGSALPKCPELPPFGTRVDLFLESIRDMKKRMQEALDKPKTKLIHGVEVPDISIVPCYLDRYYYPDAAYEKMVYDEIFIDGNAGGAFRSEHGLCYPHTEEGKAAAILHAKAMLGIAEKTAISVKPQTSLFDKLSMERKEVCDKVKNLEEFMHSNEFAALAPVNQGLLMVQLEAMRMYADTLARRIEII